MSRFAYSSRLRPRALPRRWWQRPVEKAPTPLVPTPGAARARRTGAEYAPSMTQAYEMLLLKIFTDATRPAASSVEPGTVIYNSDDHAYNISDGTNWYGPSSAWTTT